MTQTREVVCPHCAGRSAIDPEYASLPAWACPYCSTVNPMPAAKPVAQKAPKNQRDVAKRISIAATLVLALVVVVSLALQSANPRPQPRTIAGVVDALERAGLPCRDIRADPAFPPARETGSCVFGTRQISILTFSGRAQRDRTLGKLPPGFHAAGETWIVRAPSALIARAIADALNGHMLQKKE